MPQPGPHLTFPMQINRELQLCGLVPNIVHTVGSIWRLVLGKQERKNSWELWLWQEKCQSGLYFIGSKQSRGHVMPIYWLVSADMIFVKLKVERILLGGDVELSNGFEYNWRGWHQADKGRISGSYAMLRIGVALDIDWARPQELASSWLWMYSRKVLLVHLPAGWMVRELCLLMYSAMVLPDHHEWEPTLLGWSWQWTFCRVEWHTSWCQQCHCFKHVAMISLEHHGKQSRVSGWVLSHSNPRTQATSMWTGQQTTFGPAGGLSLVVQYYPSVHSAGVWFPCECLLVLHICWLCGPMGLGMVLPPCGWYQLVPWVRWLHGLWCLCTVLWMVVGFGPYRTGQHSLCARWHAGPVRPTHCRPYQIP